MIKKRNKFITFVLSMIPGAGQMYMGFMKRGLSLMLFAALYIIFCSIFNFTALLMLLPVIWFYAFFDAININGMDDAEFAKLSDDYLILEGIDLSWLRNITGKSGLLLGWTAVVCGVILLAKNLWELELPYFLSETERIIIYRIGSSLPRYFASILLVILGVKLISGRRKYEKKLMEAQYGADDFGNEAQSDEQSKSEL